MCNFDGNYFHTDNLKLIELNKGEQPIFTYAFPSVDKNIEDFTFWLKGLLQTKSVLYQSDIDRIEEKIKNLKTKEDPKNLNIDFDGRE